MKAFAILPAAAAAILAFNISSASSQGACQQEYEACMSGCTTKSAKALQDSCFTSCEGKNNFCAERIYGKRPFNGTPSNAAEQRGQAKDALARNPKEQPLPVEAREQAAQPQAQQPDPRSQPRR